MDWLLPLETLPGWPEAPEFSAAHLILIAGVLPVVTAILIAVLALAPGWARRSRGETAAGGDVAVRPGDTRPDTQA